MNEFRVYDKKEGRYLDCNNAPMLGMNGELFFHQKGATWVTSEESDRYEYEPSIGYMDVDDNIIYAGDIIESLSDVTGVYLVHPNNSLTNLHYTDEITYHLEAGTWQPRIIGNIHDKKLPDIALPEICIVEKNWQGFLQWLLDWGWTIKFLLQYKNAEDLFHDIVRNERACSKHWYTDYFNKELQKGWQDGDVVYVDDYGFIVDENEPGAIKCTLHIIDRLGCRKLLKDVKNLYEESGK